MTFYTGMTSIALFSVVFLLMDVYLSYLRVIRVVPIITKIKLPTKSKLSKAYSKSIQKIVPSKCALINIDATSARFAERRSGTSVWNF